MNKNLQDVIASIIVALIFAFIFFLMIQGLFIDIIDDFIIRDIDNEVISNLSILNFITFTYTLIIIISIGISSLLIIKAKNKEFALILSFAVTILMMNSIAFFSIKIQDPGIVGSNYYFHAQGLFMVYVLESMYSYFFILLGIFITMFIIFIIILN